MYLTTKWYVSHEILTLGPDPPAADEKLSIWENLILLRADNPEEAYRKAIEHGYANESVIRLARKKGKVRFAGLRDLVLVYDELGDGAEIEWHETELTPLEADALVRGKNDLHAFNPVSRKEK